MCGIAGAWIASTSRSPDELGDIVGRMAAAIAHRGPDAQAVWVDGESGVGLGHRRLSIIDLSEAGAQPMRSASGRFTIVFNGEIYNHPELREALEQSGDAPAWRGHSDTETLLALIDRFGLDEALKRSFGMFALALWDARERALFLARDRMGEKPLYYGWAGRDFVFGSELKALKAFPGFKPTVDPQSVSEYLRFGYVPSPRAIYKGVAKLPPGTWLRLASPNAAEAKPPVAYWTLLDTAAAGAAARSAPRDAGEDADALEKLLHKVVSSQMLSDVPLGAFLSGGVDSSLITAMMQANSPRPTRTFSIGFGDGRYNEAPYAKAVAKHLGTDHTELTVSERDALDLVPALSRVYDEPFADSSQIPTTLLARLTRQHVTVALSGDGGDELFGGYNRYLFAPAAWRGISRAPALARRGLGALVGLMEPVARYAAAPSRGDLLGRLGLPGSMLDKLGKLSEVAGRSKSVADVYFGLASVFIDPAAVARQSLFVDPNEAWRRFDGADVSDAERMMLIDALTYLPDDIMVKVDRAAMSASLESRAPFLDPRVVEFAWTVPLAGKIVGSIGKRVVRDALDRHVPRELIDRPKQGFGIPLDDWLRGGLKDWVATLLDPAKLNQSGLLKGEAVAKLWRSHLSGRRNAGPQLWTILMLQSWLGDQA